MYCTRCGYFGIPTSICEKFFDMLQEVEFIGARMYKQHRKAKRRAQMTASASPEGAQLGMSMRF